MSWQEEAECHGLWELFYPRIYDDEGVEWFDDGTIWEAFGDTSEHYDEAREICNACPVQKICLAHALEHKERFGMWGGLTPIERRRIERSARRKRLQDKRRAEAVTTADPT